MPDLSDNVNWSEVDANNNQAPPNGWPEGMMPSTVNDAARADRGALKRFWDKINPIQFIGASGGVYTFTTGNTTYPAGYIEGEVYCFRPQTASVGNDQFQVNALPPKPIWKRTIQGSAGLVPIVAHDLTVHVPAELTYIASLNAGNGAFLLADPFVPAIGDGSGTGVTIPGAFTLTAGDLTLGRTDEAYSYVQRPNTPGFNNLALAVVGGGQLANLQLNSAYTLCTGGLQVQSSWTNNPNHPPMINICDTDLAAATTGWWRIGVGSAGAFRLQKNTAAAGDFSIVTGVISVDPTSYLTQFSAGGIQVAGAAEFQGPVTFDATAPATFNGPAQFNGTVNIPGGVSSGGAISGTSLNISGNGSVTGAFGGGSVTTNALQVNGNETVSGTLSTGPHTATGLTVNGNGSVTGTLSTGAVSSGAITGTGLTINGNGNVTGTLSSGSVSTGVLTVTAGGSQFQHGLTIANSLAVTGGASIDTLAVNTMTVGSGVTLSYLAGSPGWLQTGGPGYITPYAFESTIGAGNTAFYAPNGNIVIGGTLTQSDARLKENIADSGVGLDAVLQLAPRRFNRIANPGQEELGLIAQEVQRILPQAVSACELAETEADLGINYAMITTALIGAVKEQAAQIAALEEQVRALQR